MSSLRSFVSVNVQHDILAIGKASRVDKTCEKMEL
jgi:hypothetical protein